MEATTPAEVEDWLADLNVLLQAGGVNAPPFLKPHHLVTLSLALREKGPDFLTFPERLMGYAARMGVWEAVGLVCPVVVKKKREAAVRLCELNRLVDRQRVGDVADKLARVAFSNQPPPLDKDSCDSVYIMLSELAENCYAHARIADDLHGLVCAQAWYRGGRAQIAIVDSGIGLRQSLSENPSTAGLIMGANAAEVATHYGVSSKPELGHKGYGLTLARGIAEANPGTMFYLHSHGEALSVTNGEASSYRVPVHQVFPGTLVVFEWPIDVPLRVASVYASWPDAEGEIDDDFF